MSVESPKYQVLEASDDFEIRRYEPVIVAETVVSGDSSVDFLGAGNIGFRRLANYIFGDNTSRAKIAMTAPVGQTSANEKIAMTAPVSQAKDSRGYVITFTMPSGYTLETLPRPNDASVVLRQVPSQKLAALRFSGTWSESRYREKLAALDQWLKDKQLTADGQPVFARYNPPWTPWFLRRNEILVEIK